MMWFTSKATRRALAVFACVCGLLALSGCMSDPYEGDLPWSPTATWEGTPFLPGGMGGGY